MFEMIMQGVCPRA